jgi:hypothetical protein
MKIFISAILVTIWLLTPVFFVLEFNPKDDGQSVFFFTTIIIGILLMALWILF